MVLNVKVPLDHAYLHVALRLAKHMHACYAPRDPCNTFKTPVQSRGSQDGRKMACVRRQKKATAGLQAAAEPPSSRPSSLSMELNQSNTLSSDGWFSARRARLRAIPGALERQ